ncbi:hypothetical protein M407DRAFT_80502 [Tulasnella calospora MUT 4182]|uniref:Uncharacterized protein n=1 Tax=Tulasnella calospora MUT 4182 TaxID=1051891 RepID=A0A0C3LIY1_9AGAM|nr:hypothetical protein M407DRAFT_80502 [Tulasnella calospora MUT 4182]
MPKWCKVRVKNGGDAIRGSDAKLNPDKDRDSSFIRFTQLVDLNARYRNMPSTFERRVQYGQLHSVLVCELPKSNLLRLQESKVFLLAHITPCDTSIRRGGTEIWPDATQEVVSYKDTLTSIIVDISAVEVVVGRVKYGIAEKRWGIIDRSGEGARTTFVDQDGWEDDYDLQ